MGFITTSDNSFLRTSDGAWIATSDTSPLLTLATPTNTASVGTVYSSSVAASGGASPYTYSVINGSLPTGLSINASTGAITGTPTVSGIYTFAILAMDSALGAMIEEFTIYVTSAPAPGSGIYKLVPGQVYDELYTVIPTTSQVKIPNIFADTALLGDEE